MNIARCACGCGLPRRPTSKYHSIACTRRMYHKWAKERMGSQKIPVPCRTAGCLGTVIPPARYCQECRSHRKAPIESGITRPQRGALVYDPACADPYSMSLERAREYLKADQFYIGTVVVIGDKRVEVR